MNTIELIELAETLELNSNCLEFNVVEAGTTEATRINQLAARQIERPRLGLAFQIRFLVKIYGTETTEKILEEVAKLYKTRQTA